jgi:FtsP/CotA-like multicopper oxidase with cupredoxin domain
MLKSLPIVVLCLCVTQSRSLLYARSAPEVCPRPVAGSVVTEPEELRSQNGLLKVELTAYNAKQSDGSTRYCYIDESGAESPTLRVNPGDLVVLTLKNDLTAFSPDALPNAHRQMHPGAAKNENSCASDLMTRESTNLHFHGLTIPASCHQDDVLKTSIQPSDPPFQYRFRIPEDEPPGLYWYHPHIHGSTKVQVLGGASGAPSSSKESSAQTRPSPVCRNACSSFAIRT